MRIKSALDALFPKTRQGVLAALLVQPDRSWYASELARRMGVPPSSLQRELRDLTTAGILSMRRQGRMVYFQANTESPIFSDLRAVLVKTVGLVSVLSAALKPLSSKLRVAFVHGSIATGSDQSDSDVDLMLVGSASPAELSATLRHARDLLGREINMTVYTRAEFNKKRKAGDHFLTRVLGTPKLFVLGDAHELDQSAI
jgi:DNA-binding transcriptional ArsR family regulator